MKTLYFINLTIIIINLLLGLTFVFGLFFMPLTGACQVISFIIYITQWKKISPRLKTPFIIYGVLTTITLIVAHNVGQTNLLDDDNIHILFFSGILAFYFLYLSKKQYDFSKNKLEINQLLDS